MKNRIFSIPLAICLSIFLFSCQNKEKENNEPQKLTQYVDPYIGTSDHGHVFMGANVPFGFVQLGPTQYSEGWYWSS